MDVSDIFYFFLLGEGEGGVRGPGGGGRSVFFLIENPRRGGGPSRTGGAEGLGGVCGGSGGGRRAIFFCFGAEMSAKTFSGTKKAVKRPSFQDIRGHLGGRAGSKMLI